MIHKISENFAHAVVAFSQAAAESHKAMFHGLAAMCGVDPYESKFKPMPKAEFNVYNVEVSESEDGAE